MDPLEPPVTIDNSDGMIGDLYPFMQRVSRGTYGSVCRRLFRGGKMCVTKDIVLDDNDSILHEAEVCSLCHPNVIAIQEIVFCRQNTVSLVLDRATMSLTDYMKGQYSERLDVIIPMDNELLKNIAYQIARGIACCHSHFICHGDIKDANVLLYEDGSNPFPRAVLTDFGLSAGFVTSPQYQGLKYALQTRPPEMLGSAPFQWILTLAGDIWAFGVLLLYMGTGLRLLQFGNHRDTEFEHKLALEAITEVCGESEKFRAYESYLGMHETHPGLWSLIVNHMKIAPDQRCTIFEALEHPYFDDQTRKAVATAFPVDDKIQWSQPRYWRPTIIDPEHVFCELARHYTTPVIASESSSSFPHTDAIICRASVFVSARNISCESMIRAMTLLRCSTDILDLADEKTDILRAIHILTIVTVRLARAYQSGMYATYSPDDMLKYNLRRSDLRYLERTILMKRHCILTFPTALTFYAQIARMNKMSPTALECQHRDPFVFIVAALDGTLFRMPAQSAALAVAAILQPKWKLPDGHTPSANHIKAIHAALIRHADVARRVLDRALVLTLINQQIE